MTKFLLLLGVSGVGKSTIIEELIRIDSRFTYISPYTTRTLRPHEKNKISVTDVEMDSMWENGELLVINNLYGIRYATPRVPIVTSLEQGLFPVLDWPIDRIEVMRAAFPNALRVIYIAPPSIEVLQDRLSRDGRDTDGQRLIKAQQELKRFWNLEYAGCYDAQFISEEGKHLEVAKGIYDDYLKIL